jgi:DNA polymerase III subunit gamma/tau
MKRSLYREYRPQTFSELVGQDHVARTLRNAVETDAVAHAYIFAGPRGTGKTSTARILAKALNCVGADGASDRPTATPCGVCRHCVAIADGVSLDVVEMDAASNRSIDDVRDLRDKIAFAPVDGRFKVYIIDEVHMLTREAFNALLKTLEEPPDNVVFVLATTEAHKIPETIVSRCQRFDFHRPQVTDIVRLLAGIVERENARPEDDRGSPPIDIQDEALHIIARHSQGGFRDAIGTLDKLVTYSEGTITSADVLEALGVTSSDLLFEITDIVIERRTAEALQFVQRLANEGTDYSQFIRDLLRHLRQLFLLQHLGEAASDDATLRTLGQTVELDGDLFREQLQRAGQVSPREVVHFIESLGEAQREIRDGLDPRLQLELALVKVTRPELDHSAAALEERLRRLEAAAAGAGLPPAAPHPAPAKAPAAQKPKPGPANGAAPASAPAEPANAAAPAVPADEPTPEPSPAKATAAEPAPVEPARAVQSAAPALDAPAADAPSDVAPAAEPAQELTVERVKRAWELILQRVQAARVPLYGFLRDGRPTALDGDVLVVSLASDFAARNAAQGDNAQVLADAVEGVLGRRLTARFEVVAGAQAPATAAQTSTAAGPQPPASLPDFTDQIRAAAAKLDAEVMPDDS